eukprot:365743-Chlamydomonas_euryale.AAC.37
MRHGASVFRELRSAQHRHVVDALHCRRVHVAGERLVAEDRQALLQRQLEPVPARSVKGRGGRGGGGD